MLKTVRDVFVTIAAMMFIGYVAVDFIAARRAEREQTARLAMVKRQIEGLDEWYKKAVFDGEAKGIYQQIFRQNEVLLEYQKLLLVSGLTPINGDPLSPEALRTTTP